MRHSMVKAYTFSFLECLHAAAEDVPSCTEFLLFHLMLLSATYIYISLVIGIKPGRRIVLMEFLPQHFFVQA